MPNTVIEIIPMNLPSSMISTVAMRANAIRWSRSSALLLMFLALVCPSRTAVAITVGGVDIGTLPPGKSVTITYQQKIDAPLPNGTTEISNHGTVSGSNFSNVVTDDPATAPANDPTTTPVTAQADLAITKTGPATFALGSNNTFTYTLTVTNNGASANSGGFTVTDVLPTGTTYQSAGSTSGATVNGQTVSYTNTTGLAASATQTFTIQVAVASSAADTTLQNSATVAPNGTPDDTSANNTSSVVSTAVAKSATTTAVSSSKNPSESGETVTFTATVSSVNGTPTGTVQFKDNGGNIGGPQTLNGSGVATISGVLSTGAHTITAEYSGDANFNPSTGTLASSQTVNPPPTPTPTATPTASPSPTATVSPTPTATASPSPTASPSGTPSARPVNISTRARVETADGVLIAGTIITGNEPKRVMIRAIGPSLTAEGVNDVLANPVLALYAADGTLIAQNDNWKDAQQSEIEGTPLAPKDERESAIIATLDPNSYTAMVTGHNGTSGVALAEIYDLNRAADSKLANISTRGRVAAGENVMIGGFMLGASPVDGNVIIRALGPSLGEAGLSNTLADPTLELRDANGTLVLANDNWQDDSAQAAEISASGIPPSNALESAIAVTLPRGDYTAILAGKDGTSGIALVEIYNAP